MAFQNQMNHSGGRKVAMNPISPKQRHDRNVRRELAIAKQVLIGYVNKALQAYNEHGCDRLAASQMIDMYERKYIEYVRNHNASKQRFAELRETDFNDLLTTTIEKHEAYQTYKSSWTYKFIEWWNRSAVGQLISIRHRNKDGMENKNK